MATDPVALAQALIRLPSVTPAGPEAFDLLEATLAGAGFEVTRMTFASEGTVPVENLFATRGTGRHVALCGHLDVVPAGPREAWQHDPFGGVIADGMLFGRGAQDMKGPLAAMCAAAAEWAEDGGDGRLSLLITGDEEGPSVNGTLPLARFVAERFPLDAAVVGEPTSRHRTGDTLKIGRRGSLSAEVLVRGRQGHVAYPSAADNPLPTLLAIGKALLAPLDTGTAHFAPSNLELVSLDVGNPAWNVIPATASLRFNIRFNERWTVAELKAAMGERIERAVPTADVEIAWQPGSEAFRVADAGLVATVGNAIEATLGCRPELDTGGGTSDARFLKEHCPVVEFGPVGDRLHQANERIACDELLRLTGAYGAILAAALAG